MTEQGSPATPPAPAPATDTDEPSWLEDAVDRLVDTMARERIGGRWRTRRRQLWREFGWMVMTVAAAIAVALAYRAGAQHTDVATAVPATADQLALISSLRDSTQRGDQAVTAANRCVSALERAQRQQRQTALQLEAVHRTLREREAELAQLQTAYQLAYAQLAKDKTRLQRCERQLGGTAWLVL